MTRTIPPSRLIYADVVDHLEAAGLRVGQGSADGLALPYVVVTPMPTGQQDGSIADPYRTIRYMVQVAAWGETVEQAVWAEDVARAALFDGDLDAPAGWTVMHVAEDVGSGVMRDDATASPARYQSACRYRIAVTPA